MLHTHTHATERNRTSEDIISDCGTKNGKHKTKQTKSARELSRHITSGHEVSSCHAERITCA
ncbi:hypothetical protein WMY93_021726 [Mugilogobius chulae]|uniref:Uncharacterized protein n=1 Tax=Mugilogobius chulae TaxID=88201 RepID=A0AAW0NH96_9GOBI